jgi:hypothetical protein
MVWLVVSQFGGVDIPVCREKKADRNVCPTLPGQTETLPSGWIESQKKERSSFPETSCASAFTSDTSTTT